MSIHALDNRAPSDFTLKSTGFSHNMSWCHMMSDQIITYAVLAFAFKTWNWIQNLPHLVAIVSAPWHAETLNTLFPSASSWRWARGKRKNNISWALRTCTAATYPVEQNRPTFWFGHCAADPISKPSFFIFFQYEYPCVWILALASHCLFG